MRIAFIGGGVMAEAMIRGILEKGMAHPEEIQVGEPLEARRNLLKERYRVLALPQNGAAIAGSHWVVLAVKPQHLPLVFPELRGCLKPDQVVLSIVAGTRLNTLAQGLDHNAVVRAMPNTPAQIGAGISLWTAMPQLGEERLHMARRILQTLGEEIYVEEEKYLDMATALSASGPAYVFLFMEALMDAGVYLGLPRDMAQRLVLQTFLGSSLLLKESGKHPAELRDMVTSPGGTTAEALRHMEKNALRAILLEAVLTAYHKSISLGDVS